MTDKPKHSNLGGSGAERKPHPRYADIEANRDGQIFYRGHLLPTRFDKDGYCLVSFGPRATAITAKVHRIVLSCFEGDSFLEGDHKNRNRADNQYENLRYVTPSENKRNVGVRRTSESQVRNVRWRKDRNCWQAYKSEGGRFRSLGSFLTIEEAQAEAEKYYG